MPRCLDSILTQNTNDCEIICVNDCSEDTSGEILEKYSINNNRISVLTLSRNQGLGAARNSGFNIAMCIT